MPKKKQELPLKHQAVDAIAASWKDKSDDNKAVDDRRIVQKLLLIGLAICRESEIWSKGFNLTRGEMGILMALHRAGDVDIRPTDLLLLLSMSSAGVTKQIGSLESRGLVSRKSNPAHRGGFLVGLTKNGRALAAQVRISKFWGPLSEALMHLPPALKRKAEEAFDILLDAAYVGAEKRKSRANSTAARIRI